jgi:serine protease
MKTLLRHAAARGACVLALACVASNAALPPRGAERGPLQSAVPVATETEARVIVKYKADAPLMRAQPGAAGHGAPPQHAQALANRLGLALSDGRTIGARTQVLMGRGMNSRDLADRLATQDDVEYAVVDGRMQALAAPNDPLYPNNLAPPTTPVTGQWYLRAPTSATIVDATSVVSAINAQAAWDVTTGNPNIVVAMLDTGVRFDHPDLAGKLLPGFDFISGTTVSADGDGRDADASDPGDFGCNAGELSSWHGTQTAGLVGASTNNGAGMAGTGRDIMLLPLRVLGKCGGFDSDIQAAMLWAASLESGSTTTVPRARVINMSLGASGACSAAYKDAIQQVNARGVVVVVAAGNEGLAVGTPANCPGVIGVAGVRHAGTKVGYSDLGPEVAIAAPAGNCVNLTGPCLFPLLTTSNSGTTTPVLGAAGAVYTGSGTDASLGTSFSAPLVSGTVGLMLSANPLLTPAQVLSFLKSSARAFPATGAGAGVAACTAPTSVAQSSECYCTTSTCGAGLLDAGAAVATAATAAVATISVASTQATVGTAVTLDGSNSRASQGATIATYQWSITSGATIASFTSATNAASATLLPSAAGSVVVALTITDSAGKQATSSVALSVAAVPVPSAAPTSSGGGGAMPVAWLLAWLAAVVGLRAITPRRR